MSTLLLGCHMPNIDEPTDDDWRRLEAMRPQVALTLWTAGTKHRRPVYERLRAMGVQRVIVRIGDESLPDVSTMRDWADDALAEASALYPSALCQLGNEPNTTWMDGSELAYFWLRLEQSGWDGSSLISAPLSMGVAGWENYWDAFCARLGSARPFRAVAVHCYDGDTRNLAPFRRLGLPLIVTEFGTLGVRGSLRAKWTLQEAQHWADEDVEAACQFILGGDSRGAWPDGYKIDDDEAAELGKRGPLEGRQMAALAGIDVSNWQRSIDWQKVAASGMRFTWIKACEDPQYLDPYFSANWEGAKGAGLIRGAYFFAHPELSSPATSVALLGQALSVAGGLKAGDLIALDLEAGAGDLLTWVSETLDLAERVHGVRPVLYSGHWFLGPHNLEGHAPSLGKYPLWLASYQKTKPLPPAGWDRLVFWQDTANGKVPGVQGDCDLDTFFGTEDDLRALGLPGPTPAESSPADAVTAALDKLWLDTEMHANGGNDGYARELQGAIVTLKGALSRE